MNSNKLLLWLYLLTQSLMLISYPILTVLLALTTRYFYSLISLVVSVAGFKHFLKPISTALSLFMHFDTNRDEVTAYMPVVKEKLKGVVISLASYIAMFALITKLGGHDIKFKLTLAQAVLYIGATIIVEFVIYVLIGNFQPKGDRLSYSVAEKMDKFTTVQVTLAFLLPAILAFSSGLYLGQTLGESLLSGAALILGSIVLYFLGFVAYYKCF